MTHQPNHLNPSLYTTMAKQLQFDEAARQALLRGVEKLARAVKATLGPAGKAVPIPDVIRRAVAALV